MKIKKNYIVTCVMFLMVIALSITIGVMATTNAKKNMEFNIGINYKPAFNLVVELSITKTGVANPIVQKIFDSTNPSSIQVKDYIDSITTDTINLSKEKVFADSTVQSASLKVYNYTKGVAVNLTVNGSETPVELPAYSGSGTPTPYTGISLTKGTVGVILVSLKFEEVPPPYQIISATGTYTSALSGGTYPYYVKYGSYGDYSVNWIVLGGNIAYDASNPNSKYSLKDNGSYNEHLTSSSVTGVSKSNVQFTTTTQWTSGEVENGDWKYEDGKFYIYEGSWKPVVKLLLISEYAILLNNSTYVYFDAINGQNNFFNVPASGTASNHVQLALKSMQTDILGEDTEKWMSLTDIGVTHYHVSGTLGAHTHNQYEGFFLLGDNAWQYPSNHGYNGAGEESFGLHTYFGDDGEGNNKAYQLHSPGTATYWWLRSGYCNYSNVAVYVYSDGNVYDLSVSDTSIALRPAFVLNLAPSS